MVAPFTPLARAPTETQCTYWKGCQTHTNMPLHSLEPQPRCGPWIAPLPQPARMLLVALTCPHEQHSHDDDNLACLQLPVFVQPFHGDVTCREENPGRAGSRYLPTRTYFRNSNTQGSEKELQRRKPTSPKQGQVWDERTCSLWHAPHLGWGEDMQSVAFLCQINHPHYQRQPGILTACLGSSRDCTMHGSNH